MSEKQNLKIIAFVGLAGSGKTTAVKYLTDKKYPKVYFGGVVLDAMKEAGIEHTPENEEKFRDNLRTKYGKDFVVNKIIEQIDKLLESGQHRIVADGVYSWSEYKILKQKYHQNIIFVATVASKHLRYHRLAQREIRPMTTNEAHERDFSEIENLEKGGPIAMSDFYLMNNGNYEDFYKQIDEILKQIDF